MSKYTPEQRKDLRAQLALTVAAIEQKQALLSCACLVKLMIDRGQMDAVVDGASVLEGYRERLQKVVDELAHRTKHPAGIGIVMCPCGHSDYTGDSSLWVCPKCTGKRVLEALREQDKETAKRKRDSCDHAGWYIAGSQKMCVACGYVKKRPDDE